MDTSETMEKAGSSTEESPSSAVPVATTSSASSSLAAIKGTLQRSVGTAWHTVAYGNWRRKGGSLNDNTILWLLGRQHQPGEDSGTSHEKGCESFYNDYVSRILLTYRRDFEPLLPSKRQTDAGWGCMLRSTQMMVAQALSVLHVGRIFREGGNNPDRQVRQREVIRLFEDCPSAPLSIHRLMSLAVARVPDAIGQWYSPSRAVALLRDAILDGSLESELLNGIRIYLVPDNCVVIEEIESFSKEWTKAVLVVVCSRLGAFNVNPEYSHSLRHFYKLDSCVGALGGKPKHSVYFVGFQGNNFYYLDPHLSQRYTPLDSADEVSWATFSCRDPMYMPLEQMDPSCALGFLVRKRSDLELMVLDLFDGQAIDQQSSICRKISHYNALFTVVDKRSKPLLLSTSQLHSSASTDLDDFEVV